MLSLLLPPPRNGVPAACFALYQLVITTALHTGCRPTAQSLDLCLPVQVLFNVLFPDWLQTALLTILLLFVINKTVRKGIRQWNQESKAIKQRHEDAEEVSLPPSFP